MRKTTLLAYFLIGFYISYAQDFAGYRTSNYNGVNGAFFNPANLADNRYSFDLNFFSVHSSVANNQVSFRLNSLSKTLSEDDLSDRFLGKEAGLTNGLIDFSMHAPSFLITVGKDMGIALTSRARVIGSITDFDGKLFSTSDDENADSDFPYTLSTDKNMRMAVNLFSEAGLSFGRVLFNHGQHFMKGGISLKYLIGTGNGFYNIDNLRGTIDNQDDDKGPYLTNASGKIAVGFSGIRMDEIEIEEIFSQNSRGVGGNIGFIYEFRPDHEKYKTETGADIASKNKYKFKIGLAILDIGRIKYEKDRTRSADYYVDVSKNERVYLNDLNNSEFDGLNEYFASRPDVFTPATGNNELNYKVSLPSSFQLDLDYALNERFYLNLTTQLPLANNNSKPYNNKLYSNVALTPRFETRRFGFYLPVYYNGLTRLNAGVSFRLGPFFAGSGSALTALIDNSKQADIHFGLRLGLQRKNK